MRVCYAIQTGTIPALIMRKRKVDQHPSPYTTDKEPRFIKPAISNTTEIIIDRQDIYQYLFHVWLNCPEDGMKKISKNPVSLPCSDSGPQSYEVEAVLTIDARGQIVIPKDVRIRAGINDGDKLVLVSQRNGERICCISIVSANAFSDKMPGLIQSLLSEEE